MRKPCPYCNAPMKGYYHEGPNGCGLMNSIRIRETHIHYYCRCGREYTENTEFKPIDKE